MPPILVGTLHSLRSLQAALIPFAPCKNILPDIFVELLACSGLRPPHAQDSKPSFSPPLLSIFSDVNFAYTITVTLQTCLRTSSFIFRMRLLRAVTAKEVRAWMRVEHSKNKRGSVTVDLKLKVMAERKRFELLRGFLPCTLSKGVPSTTRPSLRMKDESRKETLSNLRGFGKTYFKTQGVRGAMLQFIYSTKIIDKNPLFNRFHLITRVLQAIP